MNPRSLMIGLLAGIGFPSSRFQNDRVDAAPPVSVPPPQRDLSKPHVIRKPGKSVSWRERWLGHTQRWQHHGCGPQHQERLRRQIEKGQLTASNGLQIREHVDE